MAEIGASYIFLFGDVLRSDSVMSPGEERKAAMRRRTKAFASSIVRFFVCLDKRREDLRILGRQLLRSGTSVAANHRESSRSRSADEFVAKIELCAQEADETQLWLELLRDDCGVPSTQTDPIWQEADELIAIFVTMAKRSKE
jgi:four helix bundle protein